MTEEYKLWKFDEIPLGLKIIGLSNIILGFILIYVFCFIFILGGILCYVARSDFSTIGDLIFFIVIVRSIMFLFYFSSFLLFFSGIDILTGNSRAKKMILISVPVIILSLAYGHFVNLGNIPVFAWIGYLVASLIYIFCNRNADKFFSNKGPKLKLAIPLSILLIIYLLGFWIGKSSFS
jgi:hypothetical protein